MNDNVICYYNENGKSIQALIQEWLNENVSLWGCINMQNNDKLKM
jgi:hypothetical protein